MRRTSYKVRAMSARKINIKAGTIVGCQCPFYPAAHAHTLEHGSAGIQGPPGPTRGYNTKGLYDRVFPMGNVTHTMKLDCTCILRRDGEPVDIGTHVHVHTTGPRGEEGLPGPKYGEPPTEDMGKARHKIIVEDCKWCREVEPHDHVVMEGLRGPQGPQGTP